MELDKKAYFKHEDIDAGVETAYFLEVIRRRLIEYCRTARAECQILETYTHFLTSIDKMERIGFLAEGTRDAIDYVIYRLDEEWGKEETSDNHNSVQERG